MSPQKTFLSLCIILFTALSLQAQLPGRSLQKPDGHNGLTNSGHTYFYGFDSIVTEVSACDLDKNGLADFGGGNAPDFDTQARLANCIGKNGAETILITRNAGTIWKNLLNSSSHWTVELRVNILDDSSSQGSHGVFGIFLADANGDVASLRIKRNGFSDIFTASQYQNMDNTGWHTYRIAKNNQGFWFWRDGVMLNANNTAISGGRDSRFELFVGDFSVTLAGNWQMDYIAIDASGAYSPAIADVKSVDGRLVVSEDGQTDSYTVTLQQALSEDADVIARPIGECAEDIDLGNGPGEPITITIAAGETSATINIAAIDDDISEGPEFATITNTIVYQGLEFALPEVTVEIIDNEPYCGDENTIYLAADLNKDCYVNLKDFQLMLANWLECTNPADSDCFGNIPPPEPIHSDVFIAGQGSYPYYRIPAVVVSKAGTILAFAEGRQGGDASENDIILRRSTDNGLTWGPIQLIAEDGVNNLNNPQAVVLDDGRIILMWQHFTRGHHEHTCKPGYVNYPERDFYTCLNFISYSDDDGVSWSTPVDNTPEVKRWAGSETANIENPTSIAGGPGIGFIKRHEPHIGRIIMPYNQGPFGNWRVYAVYSDDNGQSWSYGDYAANSSGVGLGNEVQMVELSDGTLKINSRHYGGSNNRLISYSYDGGESWSPLEKDLQLLDGGGGCMASIIRFSGSNDGQPNRILFAGPDASNRSNGTVHISYDDAASWQIKKTIVPGSYAYSCLTVLPDSSIGLIYEFNGNNIRFVRFTLGWLTDNYDWVGKP